MALTLYTPTPQSGQTHSNNSPAKASIVISMWLSGNYKDNKNNDILLDMFNVSRKVNRDKVHHKVNPLQPGVAFLYPLKTSENLKVF